MRLSAEFTDGARPRLNSLMGPTAAAAVVVVEKWLVRDGVAGADM